MSNEDNVIVGTPTPLLLRASQWKWRHVAGPFSVDVPINGEVKVQNTEDAQRFRTAAFNVDEDIDVHVDLNTIVKILFLQALYPNLEEGQVFAISDLVLDRENNKLTVVGNVLEQLQ